MDRAWYSANLAQVLYYIWKPKAHHIHMISMRLGQPIHSENEV